MCAGSERKARAFEGQGRASSCQEQWHGEADERPALCGSVPERRSLGFLRRNRGPSDLDACHVRQDGSPSRRRRRRPVKESCPDPQARTHLARDRRPLREKSSWAARQTSGAPVRTPGRIAPCPRRRWPHARPRAATLPARSSRPPAMRSQTSSAPGQHAGPARPGVRPGSPPPRRDALDPLARAACSPGPLGQPARASWPTGWPALPDLQSRRPPRELDQPDPWHRFDPLGGPARTCTPPSATRPHPAR